VAGLLVSVRSAEEAAVALAGGAAVVDVKEPGRGPLGCADPETWRAVRDVVPRRSPVSVALGELSDWGPGGRSAPGREAFEGLAFRKLGLSGLGDDPGWPDRWSALRDAWGPGPGWVAVIYADWERARAPRPEAVVDAARDAGCVGLLIDTWDKSRPGPLAPEGPWPRVVARAREAGLTVALAGGLDEASIARLAPLEPDLFAVRGAACSGGDRGGTINVGRVRRLVSAAAGRPRGPGEDR
jgi:uncharacterized protein (UPF0264 family)